MKSKSGSHIIRLNSERLHRFFSLTWPWTIETPSWRTKWRTSYFSCLSLPPLTWPFCHFKFTGSGWSHFFSLCGNTLIAIDLEIEVLEFLVRLFHLVQGQFLKTFWWNVWWCIGMLAIIFFKAYYYEVKSIKFLQNICLKLVVAWGVERRIIGPIFSFHRPI